MREDSVHLFLDDDPNRAATLYQRMTPIDRKRTIWVTTVEQTIQTLGDYRERLDIVSLDHDLGGEMYVHSGRDDSGMEVIRWLERQPSSNYKHVRFVIHSWNIPAGRRMAARLMSAGYNVIQVPFGS